MTRRSSGQILPILCVLLPVLLLFVGANIHRTLFGIEKIRRQRSVDLLVLQGATQQARALNAVAALNQALKIILRRAYAYAGALTALSLCASASFGISPCTAPLMHLGKKAPKFFKGVNDLASLIGRWQDDLVQWAQEAPEQTIRLDLLVANPAADFRITPAPPRLRVHRLGSTGFGSLGAGSEETGLASGGDLLRCSENRIERADFDALRSGRMTSGLDANDSVSIHLSASDGGTKRETKTVPQEKEFWEGNTQWQFDYAVVRRCESFREILSRFNEGLPVDFGIPQPYVLDDEFETQQHLALSTTMPGPSQDPDLPADILLAKRQEILPISALREGVAEARILGTDLNEMEFVPSLARVTEVGDDEIFH